MSDLRLALRSLLKNPGFSAIVVLTLALGVGASSAIFAAVDAVLLRPLPFPNAERLVVIEEFGPRQSGRSRIDLANLPEWAARTRSFEALAAVWTPGDNGGAAMLGADGTAETVPSQSVTPEFFEVLRIRPLAGRTFQTDDASPVPGVAVLSERFWRQRFGGDPALIGRDITLDGRLVTVIGIVPASFEYLRPSDLWMLLPAPRATAPGGPAGQCGICRLLQVVGRLRPGVSVDAGRMELTAIADSLARDNGAATPRRMVVTHLRDVVIGSDLRVTSVLLLGVVAFLLVVCCANVANLAMTHAAVRRRELAVLSALGASRRQIVRQMLTESVVLAAGGGIGGLALATTALAIAPAFLPPGLLPGTVELQLDSRVLGFGIVATAAVMSGFAVALSWRATGLPLGQLLGSVSRTASSRDGGARRVLVAGQIAMAVLVLCMAGLLIRTLSALDGQERGFLAERDRVLTANVTVDGPLTSRYSSDTSLLQLYEEIEEQVVAVPGVRSAAWATTLPLGGSQLGRDSFRIAGSIPSSTQDLPEADYQVVSRGYFAAMALPIVAGRPFGDMDTSNSTPVSIVSEAFVARHLSGRNPLGARIEMTSPVHGGRPISLEIVGVARQVKERADEREPLVQIYVPNTQNVWPEAYLVIRASGDNAEALAPTVRAAIARVERLLPVDSMTTLHTIANAATSHHRFRATIVFTFAVVALVLAMVGIFGLLALLVQQRRREIGVRIALGAVQPSQVLALIATTVARLTAAGLFVGLVAAAATARWLRVVLFGVEPLDPVTFASASLLVIAAAIAAAALPTLRATHVDPITALRTE